MNRIRFSKAISMFVTTVIAMSGLPSMVLADVINAPTYHSVTDGLEFEVTENVTSSWSGHSNVEYTFTNTGDETIHNWFFTFNVDASIDNIWNAAIYETDGSGTYTITSNGWNQDILPGNSVTVGMSLSSDIEEIDSTPSWYLLNTSATTVDVEDYTVSYTEYSSWESGFTGQITLEPEVDCPHWSLIFDSNREITAVSSAVLKTVDESRCEITHDENNMRLIANNAYNFGVQGLSTEEDLEFLNTELIVINLAYHLTDDTNANGILDYQEAVGGGSITPTPTPTPTEEPTPTADPTIEPSVTDEPTEEPTEIPTGTVTPTDEPSPTPMDYDPYYGLVDRDSDGLLDYQEEMYMTDPENPDTDGDGLLDGDEIDILTNPTVADTNGNGISDYEEDYDGDGIHNGGEYATDTCMFAFDSDYDGINDHDEVFLYGIDPRSEDSDGDGIKDGDEVLLGLNPGSNDTNNDGITDDYVMFNQVLSMAPIVADHPQVFTEVSISGDISGLISSNTTIEDTFNKDFYCTDVYGRIGVPIQIESAGNFESMTLSISYDETLLGNTEENDLGVLWFDESTGFFMEQEQTIVDEINNTITLELNHFSTYVVVDLEMWNNPILPDYSSYICEVTDGEYGYIANAYVPAVEDIERSAWFWWHLTNDQYIKLATLSAEAIQQEGWHWDFVYTWLVMDKTDNDSDGLHDAMERSGVLGSNHHIYYSSSDSADGDGDGLTDKEELGVIYTFTRGSDGRYISISLDGQVVYENMNGVIDVDSQYFVLNNYLNCVPLGQTVSVAVLISDAEKIDSDEDGYNDTIDARPIFVNDAITYVLSNPDHLDSANMRIVRYRETGIEVIALKFQDAQSFDDAWEGIGLYEEFYLDGEKLYGDKYYYNAQNVVICTHGAPYGFSLGDGDVALNSPYMMYVSDFNPSSTVALMPSILAEKRIETLYLYACSCGGPSNYQYNIAEDFLQNIEGLNQVIAPDVDLFRFGAVNTFQGYLGSEIDYCTDFEYENYCNSVVSNHSNGLYFYQYYEVYENPRGFVVFRKNEEIDLYSDDVIYGILHTTQDNYNNNRRGGVLDYSPHYSSYVDMNNWHDPVID